MTAFTRDFAVKEIAGIELDSGFRGQYFHDAATAGLGENGGLFQRSGWGTVSTQQWSYPSPKRIC